MRIIVPTEYIVRVKNNVINIDTNWVHGNLNNFMNIYPIVLKLSINEIQMVDYNVDW